MCTRDVLFPSFMPTLGGKVGPKVGKVEPKVAPREPKGPKRSPKSFPGTPKNHKKKRSGAPSVKKSGPGGSRGALGKENDTKIKEKTINFDAENMQKKASIPLSEGAVPKKGEHSVFFC